MRELGDIEVERIDLVDSPATKRRFLLMKAADDDDAGDKDGKEDEDTKDGDADDKKDESAETKDADAEDKSDDEDGKTNDDADAGDDDADTDADAGSDDASDDKVDIEKQIAEAVAVAKKAEREALFEECPEAREAFEKSSSTRMLRATRTVVKAAESARATILAALSGVSTAAGKLEDILKDGSGSTKDKKKPVKKSDDDDDDDENLDLGDDDEIPDELADDLKKRFKEVEDVTRKLESAVG